jgi:hypothetical protein
MAMEVAIFNYIGAEVSAFVEKYFIEELIKN